MYSMYSYIDINILLVIVIKIYMYIYIGIRNVEYTHLLNTLYLILLSLPPFSERLLFTHTPRISEIQLAK